MFCTSAGQTAVSDFITVTCRDRAQPNYNRFYAVLQLLRETPDRHGNDISRVAVLTPSGSASEFFIDPMLPLIGDVDILYHRSDELAVPEGHHVTDVVQLPVEFHASDEIVLFDFTETVPGNVKLPGGYVILRYHGKLIKTGNNDVYRFESQELATETAIITVTMKATAEMMHGPAMIMDGVDRLGEKAGQKRKISLKMDRVRCLRCLEWPPQAAEWSTRIRKYGCPDSVTIQRVINEGCDLVYKAPRQLKDDEFCIATTHRISFSRAETRLLNCWTPKQQLTYHILRYFMKAAGFIESANQTEELNSGIFSNYHLKTLMLWSCERQSPEWWTGSLVRITTELLLDLSKLFFASDGFPQYFITRCNLFIYFKEFDRAAIEHSYACLALATEERLAEWLFENYVRECAQFHDCPNDIRELLMNDLSTAEQTQFALSSFSKWRVDRFVENSAHKYNELLIASEGLVRTLRPTHIPLFRRYLEALREVDGRLIDFNIALLFLQFIDLLARGGDSFELIVNVVYDLMHFEDSVVNLETKRPLRYANTSFTKATSILMKLNRVVNADKMLQVELAKAFLHMSIDNSDAYQEHDDCLARVYLASLYHSTEQHRTAIDHLHVACTTQGGLFVVERQLLPDNDDEISIVSGLIALYQFMASRTPSCQQAPVTSIFTAKWCAMHYMVKSSRAIVCEVDPVKTFQRYKRNVIRSRCMFIGDALLVFFTLPVITFSERNKYLPARNSLKLYSRRSSCNKSTVTRSAPKTFRLRCLLMKKAVEHLTVVRLVMSRDYGSFYSMVTSDYEAVYAYRCVEYERCLELCQQNIERFRGDCLRVIRSFSLPLSDLLLLMDDECLAVVGLCRLGAVYADYYQRECVNQKSLSLYLAVQCKLKLNHSPKSFIDLLRDVREEYRRDPNDRSIDVRLILTFAYRKVLRLCRLCYYKPTLA